MATLTDHQLIEQIQLGQSEALGQLFDRYGDSIFDFLARVVGDPDEAVHLVVDVFTRVQQSIAGIPEHESIRGALFALARETALSGLRKRGWLDALPSNTPLSGAASDLANDIWQSARAMPASQRAVLAIVEHQALSPAEQAAALGIAHHALPDVIAEARRSFDELFDLHARAEGKPTFESVDAEKVPGLQRRIPDSNASLFTFLPSIVLLDVARLRVRNQVVASLGQTGNAPAALPAYIPASELPPEAPDKAYLIPVLLGIVLVAGLVCAILALAAFNGNQPAGATADTIPPVIKQLAPQDGAILPPNNHVVVQAIYDDDGGIDVKSVRLLLDNHDVTVQSIVTDASVSYTADLGPGQHVALVQLKDLAGNATSQTWIFTISTAAPTASPSPTFTPLATATLGPTSTPLPTPTNAPTATPRPTATNTPPPELPDLVVTDISLSPSGQIIYSIRNNGPGDVTQPFLIQVSVDNVGVDSNRKISSLGAGQETSLYVPNYIMSGTHAVTVRVNSDLAIKESNYGNDELTRTLSGPTPTPIPTPSPSLTPAK